MQFECPTCGTFLNSVDGAPAICRCDGTFKSPPAEGVAEKAPVWILPDPEPEPVAEPPTPVAEEPVEAVTAARATALPPLKPKRARRKAASKKRSGR